MTHPYPPITDPNAILLRMDCVACDERFQLGDVVALLPLGPGKSESDRAAAREGRAYNAVARPIHWACFTGHTTASAPTEPAPPDA